MKKVKKKPAACDWCGTKYRGTKRSCPRGPSCRVEKANHEALTEQIRLLPDQRSRRKAAA